MRIFILGVNGFIGNALVRAILSDTDDWKVSGIDVERDRLSVDLLRNDRFEFHHGDLSISKEWVEFQVKRSDVVVPLAAVAIPKIYVENPLMVFELDFLANLRVVQWAAQYKKRLVFPSTSEVYGMCPEDVFDEEESNLVLGPISKHRWIYSSAKQLLDRVIHAYGLEQDFHYTIFRPFNWIGPHLDRIDARKIGNSRVVTQFISSVVYNEPIHIVDGGAQRRCLLYLDDGIDGLMRILHNEGNKADRKIINLGNPANDISIAELARAVVDAYQSHARSKKHPFTAGILSVDGESFYGKGYQDIASRRPSVARAREVLGWEPKTGLGDAIRLTLDSFLSELGPR